jgi:hypothetical protein
MTARGKNRLFMTRIAEILQLDDLPGQKTWNDMKRAMTSGAVRAIHEAVGLIWPSADDLDRVLHAESDQQNALYIGSYQPDAILRGLARHSLYSESILVLDPLLHPRAAAGKFNPVLQPESHRSNTLVALRLLILLSPWVDANVVRVIRAPTDFDDELFSTTLEVSEQRYAQTSELAQIAEAEAVEAVSGMQEYKDYYVLVQPDFKIAEHARRNDPSVSEVDVTRLLAVVHEMRDRHPFYVDPPLGPGHPGSFLSFSSGTNYEVAKIVAAKVNAHLVTDMRSRWKEIELDRTAMTGDAARWTSFAKAFGSAKLRFLDRADLALALRLRKEDRLEDLRLFFRKLWNAVAKEDTFNEALATDLASEMNQRVLEAEDQWGKIDSDLLKWFGGEVAAAGAVAVGTGKLLPSMVGVAIGGTFNIVQSLLRRRGLKSTYPASFFLAQ